MNWKKFENAYDQLAPRERTIVVVLVFVVVFFIFAIFAFFIMDSFDERRERIRALDEAISLIKKNAPQLQEKKENLGTLDFKAAQKPPMLQGHLDQLATQLGLSPNFTPQKPRDLGENQEYQVESVEVRFNDAPIASFIQFLDKVEKGNSLILVTEIKLNTRRGQPDRVDPTVIVSSYYKRNAEELKELHDKAINEKNKGKNDGKKDEDKGGTIKEEI